MGFDNVTYIRLVDIASIERANGAKEYHKGSILIALSATKGDIELLTSQAKVSSRYAVVNVNDDYMPEYIFISLQSVFDEFLYKYQTGMNLQFEELKHLILPVHKDLKIQKKIIKMFDNVNQLIEKEKSAIEMYKKQKEYHLQKMFI